MSAQARPAPGAVPASSRRGVPSPSSATKRGAQPSPTPTATLPAAAAAAPSPAPSHAAAAFAATQELLQDHHAERKENTSPVRMKAKLEPLAARFDGLEDELTLSRSRKKADEDRRIHLLQTQLTNLQSSLALESKNRALSVKALQAWLTDRIATWTEQIEAPMTQRLQALAGQVEFLAGRIDGLERKQQADREEFPRLVDGRCAELLSEMSALKSQFASNVSAREEKEKRILLKVASESNRAAVQFAADKGATEQRMQELRQAIDDEVAARVRAHDMMKQSLRDEVGALKTEQAREKEERSAADEDLVQAINHYAAALQDGLKIVSTQ